jgi:hypothetical protein
LTPGIARSHARLKTLRPFPKGWTLAWIKRTTEVMTDHTAERWERMISQGKRRHGNGKTKAALQNEVEAVVLA